MITLIYHFWYFLDSQENQEANLTNSIQNSEILWQSTDLK